jgi:hypothetical protein
LRAQRLLDPADFDPGLSFLEPDEQDSGCVSYGIDLDVHR